MTQCLFECFEKHNTESKHQAQRGFHSETPQRCPPLYSILPVCQGPQGPVPLPTEESITIIRKPMRFREPSPSPAERQRVTRTNDPGTHFEDSVEEKPSPFLMIQVPIAHFGLLLLQKRYQRSTFSRASKSAVIRNLKSRHHILHRLSWKDRPGQR